MRAQRPPAVGPVSEDMRDAGLPGRWLQSVRSVSLPTSDFHRNASAPQMVSNVHPAGKQALGLSDGRPPDVTRRMHFGAGCPEAGPLCLSAAGVIEVQRSPSFGGLG